MMKCRKEGFQLVRAGRMDPKKIEKAAVLAVKNLIQPCETVDDKLDDDDKNILVDGSLELYRSADFTIANFIGKIDVQVKGKTGKLDTNRRGFAKYPIRVEDLRRYLDVFHGVLFFCVSLGATPNSPTAKSVFYAQLLPYDINQILADTRPDQKKVSVRFNPFPEDPREITRLLQAFHAEKERQLGAKVSGYGFLDKNFELPPDINSFTFSMQLFPGEPITTLNSLREGPYIYGKDADGQLTVFGKMGDVSAFVMGVPAQVRTGEFEHETTVFSGLSDEGNFIEFDGVRILLDAGKARIDYTVGGSFQSRYNTARFMRELMKTGTLDINGHRWFTAKLDDSPNDAIQMLDDTIEGCGRVIETLEALSIQADWDPSQMSDKELDDIGFMRRLLVEKKPLKNRKLNSPMVHFDIQGAQVFAFAQEDEEGSYTFEELFSDRLCFVFGQPDEDTGELTSPSDPVPPLAALGEEGYRKVVNLDPAKAAESFERFPVTATNQTPLNQKLLEMLTAYDKGSQQPEALLACAVVLAKKLHSFDATSETYRLNLLQTIKRHRDFEPEERKDLQDIALDSAQTYVRAAAYALLGNAEMAARCLERCTEAERKQIEDYPIFQFFKPGVLAVDASQKEGQ